MQIFIKNMVCNRCIIVVGQELEKLGIEVRKVSMGEIDTLTEIADDKMEKLKVNLTRLGFSILDDAKRTLIEKIKGVIIQQIHHSDGEEHQKFSDLISKTVHRDYSYLSNLFSDVEGITIEKYIINQKIEKVKELLIYDELTLSEIAYRLNYSSVAHLSNQFKKVTGLTPSHFKKMGENRRKPLDQV